MRTRLVVVAALALVATGCSGDGGNDKASDETGGGMPACSDVWVEGKTLPADYDGCAENGGTVAMVGYDCKDGSTLTGYNDELYATLGGEIRATSDQKAYSKAFGACMG